MKLRGTTQLGFWPRWQSLLTLWYTAHFLGALIMQSSGHILGLVISILLITACSGKDPVGTATSSSSSSSSSSGKALTLKFVKMLDGIETPAANVNTWVYSVDGNKISSEKTSNAQGLVELGAQPEQVTFAYTEMITSIYPDSTTKYVESYFNYLPFQDNTSEIKIFLSPVECTKNTTISILPTVPNEEIVSFSIYSEDFRIKNSNFEDNLDGKLGVFDICITNAQATSTKVRLEATTLSGEAYLHTFSNFDLHSPIPIAVSPSEASAKANITASSQVPLRIPTAVPVITNEDEFILGPVSITKTYFPSEHANSSDFFVIAQREDNTTVNYSFKTAPIWDEAINIQLPAIRDRIEYTPTSGAFSWHPDAACKDTPNVILLSKSETSIENGFNVNFHKTIRYFLPKISTNFLWPEIPHQHEIMPNDLATRMSYFIFLPRIITTGENSPTCDDHSSTWISGAINNRIGQGT